MGEKSMETILHVIWSHGQESGPWGTKLSRLVREAIEAGHQADSLDYRDLRDPDLRVQRLAEHCRDLSGAVVLCGSSLGGYVSLAAAPLVRPAGIFVLAPAVYLPGRADSVRGPFSCPVAVVHGWRDDVVPPENSVQFAREHRAALHLIDGDHRLRENIEEIVVYYLHFLNVLRRSLEEASPCAS